MLSTHFPDYLIVTTWEKDFNDEFWFATKIVRGEKRKVEIIKRLLTAYCHFDSNKETNNLRDKILKILIRPSMLTKNDHPYYSYLGLAWDSFDKLLQLRRICSSPIYKNVKCFDGY